MVIETVPIDSVSSDPSNVRVHPERNLETIKGSLARFGQQKPIVVDANGIVRAGNGTLEAAKALGWTEIQVVKTELTGSEATAFSIVDNRSADSSEFDEKALVEILTALKCENADLAVSAGFSLDEISELIDRTATVEAPADFPVVDENIETQFECPKCHYRWSGSSAPGDE
jgi:ParB-like chromosome segregation protein Spo0J